MNKACPVCEYDFKDGDDVVAIMISKFHYIPSEVNFAIENPSRCIDLVHAECFDYEEYGDEGDIDDNRSAR